MGYKIIHQNLFLFDFVYGFSNFSKGIKKVDNRKVVRDGLAKRGERERERKGKKREIEKEHYHFAHALIHRKERHISQNESLESSLCLLFGDVTITVICLFNFKLQRFSCALLPDY